MEGASKSPRSLVVTVRTKPVPALVRVTVAPGTRASLVSTTAPRMLPVATWAARGCINRAAIRSPNVVRVLALMGTPLIASCWDCWYLGGGGKSRGLGRTREDTETAGR